MVLKDINIILDSKVTYSRDHPFDIVFAEVEPHY